MTKSFLREESGDCGGEEILNPLQSVISTQQPKKLLSRWLVFSTAYPDRHFSVLTSLDISNALDSMGHSLLLLFFVVVL